MVLVSSLWSSTVIWRSWWERTSAVRTILLYFFLLSFWENYFNLGWRLGSLTEISVVKSKELLTAEVQRFCVIYTKSDLGILWRTPLLEPGLILGSRRNLVLLVRGCVWELCFGTLIWSLSANVFWLGIPRCHIYINYTLTLFSIPEEAFSLLKHLWKDQLPPGIEHLLHLCLHILLEFPDRRPNIYIFSEMFLPKIPPLLSIVILFFLGGAVYRFHMDPSGTFVQCDARAIGSASEGAQSSLQEVYHKVSKRSHLWYVYLSYICSDKHSHFH